MAGKEAEKKNIAHLKFDISGASEQLNKLNQQFKTLSSEADKFSKNISNKLGNNVNFKINTNGVKQSYEDIKKMSDDLGKNTTNTIMKNQGRIEYEIIKTKEVEKREAIKTAQEQIRQNERVANSTETLYDKITQYAKTYVIYQGFNALKKGISETIDEMVEVEQQMVAIDRVMNIANMDVNAFRDDLIQLAYDYGNSFNNVADISLRLAQAGIKGQNNLSLTEKTLLALNTAELDATQATDDMVAVMSQWNLITDDATQTAKEYGDIIDKVNKVADNFPTTSADILDALKKTSSAFNLAGADINETIATIVAAEKASQRGGKVIGTALGNITQQLKDAGKVDIAESLGISFFADEAKTQYKPIMEIFQSLSDKMQQLKEEGKESSAEMQQLLSVFTVFRRNIGASLLGEMAGGEESTYQQVIKTIRDSLGYSLEENTKYMNTAKAAQEQFNATLLQLKTEVWDNKVETVYRDLLKGGTDFIKWLENLSKDMKLLPAIIGVVTAGFSLLGKKMDYNSLKKYTISLKEMQKALEIYNKSTEDGTAKVEKFYKHLGKETPDAVTRYTNSLKGAEASMAGLITNTVLQTVKQVALNLVIAAGEAALSFGLSLAIQAVVTLIGNWIHATENASSALKDMNNNITDGSNTLDSYADKFTTLRQEMESGNLTQEEFNKKKLELKDLQEELIKKYGSEAKGINLVTGEIKAQVKAIEDLNKADYKKYIQENEKYINQLTEDLNKNITLSLPEMFKTKGGLHSELYDSLYNYLNENFMQMSERTLGDATFFNVKNVGTPEEMLNYYRAIYDGLKQYREEIYETLSDDDKKYLDTFIQGISNTIKDTNDKYAEALTQYQEYLNNKLKYDNFYENEYAKILEARAKVAEASTKGDSQNLARAQEELNKAYQEAIEKAASDPQVSKGMTELLKEQIDNANEEIEKEQIGLKIGVQGDEIFDSIQNILNQMGNIDIKSFKTGLENTDIQTQFGNIDILREGITWNEDNIKKYREQLEELNLDINNLAGSYSNILGASKAFETQAGEIEVAYSPMLKTDHGLIPLYQDEIEEYIQEVLNQAQEDISNGKYSNLNEAVLAIDSEGIEDYVNSSGDKIKGLIADVGDTAIETGSKMHENWMKIDEAGGTTEKFRELKDVLDENGISVEQLTELFEYLGFSIGNVNDKTVETGDNLKYLSESTQKSIEDLANLDSGFSSVYSAMDEFNNQGYISASTLQNLINNDLLRFFDVVNGKLAINEAAMANAATAAKAKAIEDLQAKAAAEIAAIAFNTEGNAASGAAGTTGVMTTKTNQVKNALIEMTPEVLSAADAWQKLNAAMGANIEGLGQDQINQINAIMNNLGKQIKAVNSIKISGVSYGRTSARSSGGGSSGSSSAAANAAQREAEAAAKAAQKAEEDAYKERLKKFKDYISEKERLETRWVKKQKELGLLSNNDYLYITQQRIERYKKYLEEVRKATWMNTEDRLELEKTYSEKIEDLQVDYLDYLNDKLKEQQDQIEKNYDERIDRIKDEATERINALKKVEDENDRIRAKEEYEKKRQEHLNDISYWEQRTGREAQEALKEAKKNLQELDEEWQQQLEDWSIDDQIKAIEDERDAQIKATEEAQEAEIKGIEKVYDEKVKKFAETGEIIYEGSTIQSKKLYNQYKTNFIDPITNDLKKLNAEEKKPTTAAKPKTQVQKQEQQYETYLIKRGDTLSAIARRYGTTVDKIMAANPYVKNRNLIYAGKTLQIPKFHEGGIVGGNVEGFALLKPKEVVLKPEWAEGINKLASMARNKDNPITNNSTVVEVKGNLVHLDAKIDNRTDADYVVKKVEKVLKDKFNIKK